MIAKFFERYNINQADKIVIACSGGADSMYLLKEVMDAHPKESILVAHFNHNLRGEESDEDCRFLQRYCAEKQLALHIGSGDIAGFSKDQKIGIEEAARIKRYAFLEDVRSENRAKHILTAHHLDDSVETFIFNLIRGTKLGGLTGIDESNGNILRPLLHTLKKDILAKCEEDGIPYRNDSSNSDDTILRNHIRLSILPQFDIINPNYKRNLDDIMEYFKEMQSNIENDLKKDINGDNSFDIEGFKKLQPFKQKEFIAYIFKLTNNGTIGLSRGNIEEVLRFISDKGNHTKKDIRNMHLFKKNGKIYF